MEALGNLIDGRTRKIYILGERGGAWSFFEIIYFYFGVVD
jgi:hypothetical protein